MMAASTHNHHHWRRQCSPSKQYKTESCYVEYFVWQFNEGCWLIRNASNGNSLSQFSSCFNCPSQEIYMANNFISLPLSSYSYILHWTDCPFNMNLSLLIPTYIQQPPATLCPSVHNSQLSCATWNFVSFFALRDSASGGVSRYFCLWKWMAEDAISWAA